MFEASEKFVAENEMAELQSVFQKDYFGKDRQPGLVNPNVLYTFNAAGVQKLGIDLQRPLMALFEQMRHEKANFWKFQINVIWSSDIENQRDLGTKNAHVDQWALHNGPNTCRLTAFQTNILYVAIPKDMQGGELVLYRRGTNVAREAASGRLMTVTPLQNLLVKFQGDLPHQVQDFVADAVSPRVSIALEQFYFPDILYQYAVEYDVIRPFAI